MNNPIRKEKPPIPSPICDGLSCILYSRNYHEDVKLTLMTLSDTLDKLCGVQIKDYEIILVDDGSNSDVEFLELLQFCKSNPRFLVLHHSEEQGLGAAFYLGLGAARYPLLFLSTADNRFDYTQIKDFLGNMLEYDVVIGYRPERQDPFLRKVASGGWNFLVNLLFGWRLKDINCTFKMFRREILSQLHLTQLRSRHMIFNTELLTLFIRNGYKILELPVSHVYGNPEINTEVSIGTVLLALFRIVKLRLRLTGDKMLGYLGFVTGAFSRSNRPMEVFLYRRSRPLVADFTSKNCPICNSSSETLFFFQPSPLLLFAPSSHYKLIFCTNCQNAFTDPLPPEKELLLKADAPLEQLNWFERFFLRWFAVRRVGRILQTLSGIESPRVLDIGGGNCLFANSLARSQCQVVVVEPNVESEKYADKQSGVQFIPTAFSSKLIQDGTLAEQSFDCITMWQSLQSLHDIGDVFDTIRRLLKPDGYLYISTPNLASLQAEIGKEVWTYLDISYQVHLFTPTGLLKVLRNKHFIPVRFFFFSLEYDVFGFYQTILNLLSRSHNYYYLNRAKRKKIAGVEDKYTVWVKIVTALGIIWLPLAILLALGASAMGKQTCIEVICAINQKARNK